MKKTLICHSFPAWDSPYVKSTIELIKRLSSDYRVIFIDYHYTWKDLLVSNHAPKQRLLGFKNRWRKVNTRYGDVEIYNSPPVFPVNWINQPWLFKLMVSINGWLLRGTFRRIQRRLSAEETILINACNPIYGTLTDKSWNVSKKIYYCYDEMSGMPWSSKWGPVYENTYLTLVDLVITTSIQLQAHKSQYNQQCALVKNGVDLNIFQKPQLEKTKNKVIGYIGAIDDRIDAGLVKALASSMPDYQFRFIGPLKSQKIANQWKGQTNIECTGSKEQRMLPELINQMDLCIIPFVKNALTASIYPLKVNEYLAMGKPVVSTGFSDLSDFDTHISLADEPESFYQAIQRELKGNSRFRIQKRIRFASGNNWEARAREFSALLS